MPGRYQLAQMNITRCKAPLDSPIMRDFVDLLPAVNALADASPVFVWRVQPGGGDATGIRVYDDPLIIINLTVWSGLEELRDYVYRSTHGYAMRRRKDWFARIDPPLAMWWVPAGYR